MRSFLSSLSGLICLSLVQPLLAGQISPNLEAELNNLSPGETLSAIVTMRDQFPVHEVDWDLHGKEVSRAERHELVVTELQELANATQADLKSWLKSNVSNSGLKEWSSFWVTNALHVEATEGILRQIADRSEVGELYIDYPIENEEAIITPVKPGADVSRTMSDGLAAINAPAVWAMGITGAGALVCNIDTGVDGAHTALTDRWRGNTHPAAECFHDPVSGQSYPYDSGSHGTHTMGTITGMSPSTGDTTGVAFGAEWIASATIDHPDGGGLEGTITLALEAFQWAMDPDLDPATVDDVPDVISNSWGIPHGSRPECDATFYTAIDNVEAGGTVVVFAAGNEGSTGLRSPSSRAATIYSTFAVGALDVSDPNAPFVASFSSRGPSACSADPILQIKPEISAPGVNVYSSVPGGGYQGGWDGTSMATPHVAGVVALMRSANPNLDVITIKQIIMDTALDIDAAGDDNNTGHGMIDAHACVLAGINGYGSISGVVTGDGSPIPATVSIVGGQQSVMADGTGAYSLAMPGDSSYTVDYSYFGYVSQTANVSIVGEADVVQNMNLVSAPTATLSGFVYDPDGLPVVGASLTVLNTPLAPVNSDGSGFYTIDMPTGASYDVHAVAGGLGELTQNLFFNASTTLDFSLPWDPRFSPSDPDSYGYRIYDSNDGAGAPTHVWNSIAATGTALALGDDATSTVAAPFPYNFYGATFTDLTVCSNGFVTPGTSGSTTFSNSGIPSTGTPNGSIYAIWDDLNPSSAGTVYTEYRAGSGEFVVEYSGVVYYGTSDPVDFQIIIRDPGVHPTTSGDAQWLIHYNSGTRNSNTTGIESGDGLDGIQYVLDGVYDVHSSDIVAGLSMLITTPFGDTGTLEGTVTDAGSGDPISGASVDVNGQIVNTDGVGYYSLNLGVGTVPVSVSAFGYDGDSGNATILVSQTTVLDFQLNAQGMATLSGTVYDSGAAPMAGATVEVLNSPYTPVLTDGSGLYTINVLDNTSWDVRATGGGQGSQLQTVMMSGNTVLDFNLPGDPAFSPSDPDAYGYRIFDSNDGAGAPAYNWVSIAGTGTQLPLTDDSYSEETVPFSYDFYGASFTTLSVSSNGYVTPGTGFTNLSNDDIPTVSLPNGCVYGIWDDLNPSSAGGVYMEYSAAHGGLVVEYNGVPFYGTTDLVSFQIILLDPTLFPTPTGDAAWLIHYNTGDRFSSTIGIEDGAGLDGVQYVYNGNYDATSSPIDAGSISLLITTNPNGIEQGEDTFAPTIAHTPLGDTNNTAGPWTVNANITDASGVASAELDYRVNGGSWTTTPMAPARVAYTADIPGPLSFNDMVEYRISATDASMNSNTGTTNIYSFLVVDYAEIFCEDFETGDLGTFTVETYDSLGNSWVVTDRGDAQGFTAYIVYSGVGQVDHSALISPAIDCSGLATVDLNFWHSLQLGYSGAITDAWVRGSTDGGVTFDQLIVDWHADNEPAQINVEGDETFDISAWAAGQSDVRIMYEFYDIYDWYWYVDDVCLAGASAGGGLDVPDLSIDYSNGGNMVSLNWSAVAGANSYRVLEAADAFGSYAEIAMTGDLFYNQAAAGNHSFFRVVASSEVPALSSRVAGDRWKNRVHRAEEQKGPVDLSEEALRREVNGSVVSDFYRK